MTVAREHRLQREPGATVSHHEFAHVPALDGLRGIAVVAVIVFHADLQWAVGGFLGVDMFFVLSGYLITSLLCTEHLRRGAISLSGFWSRRARRLFPALGFLCLGALVFAALRPEHPSFTNLRGDMLAGLGYVANWRFLLQGGDYFSVFAPSPLRHLWSLAIEEQFYLVWPLAFLLVVRLKRPALLVFAAAVVSAVLMAATVDGADPSSAYYGTHTHAHGLLIGAALAFVAVRPYRWLPAAGITAALAMLGCMLWFNGADLWVYRGGLFIYELLTVVVIAACVHPGATRLGAALAWAPLRAIGLVSYGLYLWHWPVFVLVDEQLVSLFGNALLGIQLVLTVGVTLFSYFVIERPFRRGMLPGRHAVALVPLVAGGLVALLLVVSASLESPIANAVRVGDGTSALRPAHPGTLRVLLVGDSSAESLAPGIEKAAGALGIEFASGAVAGCALDWDVEQLRDKGGPWYELPNDGDCRWPRTWPKLLRRYRPDLVLMSFGLWDVNDHRIGGRTFEVGTANWRARMERRAMDAVRVVGRDGARVGIVLSASLLAGVRPLNDLLTRVARRADLPVFDLGPIVDPNSSAYRWDGVHYTESGSRVVGARVAWWVARLSRAAG